VTPNITKVYVNIVIVTICIQWYQKMTGVVSTETEIRFFEKKCLKFKKNLVAQ
jgi:hypothetical protein